MCNLQSLWMCHVKVINALIICHGNIHNTFLDLIYTGFMNVGMCYDSSVLSWILCSKLARFQKLSLGIVGIVVSTLSPHAENPSSIPAWGKVNSLPPVTLGTYVSDCVHERAVDENLSVNVKWITVDHSWNSYSV